jgi:TPR repeat protein
MTAVNSIDQLLKLGNEYFYEDENIRDAELAKTYFKKAASLGSMEALLELALIYEWDGQKDLSKKCLEKLVSSRYAPAIYKIIVGEADYELDEEVDWDKVVYEWYEKFRELQDGEKIYEYARLRLKSWDKSFGYELLQEAANCDYARACDFLGRAHLHKEIKNPSLDQALYWLIKSVKLGNRFACRELGDLYLLGKGKSSTFPSDCESFEIEPDHDKALDFYKKAILMGWHSIAESRLYYYFKKGLFLQGNFDVVEKWLLYCAEKNNEKSMKLLGMEYASGTNVSKNGHLAIYWLRRAAEFKDIQACLKLSEIYFNEEYIPRDFDETILWFEIAASQCDKQIDVDLTFKFLKNIARNGFEVELLENIATKMFKNLILELAVAENEYVGSYAFRVGLHHELGLGTAQDFSNARHYYELAVQNGFNRAKLQLEKLRSDYD